MGAVEGVSSSRGEKGKISRFRLALNVVGCAAMIAFCLLVGVSLAEGLNLITPPPPDSPDGDKPMGIMLLGIVFCALFGALALISLVRSVKAWRATPGR